MASVGEKRPYAIRNGFDYKFMLVWSVPVLVFDLKPESEWGEPGPPTAVPDLPDQLGPCTRRHRYGSRERRADPR
jgi:hypothetical protein